MLRIVVVCRLLALALMAAIVSAACAADTAPLQETATIVSSAPHDRDAFTQGLLFHAGALYETTGRHGRSTLRRVDPETGKVLASRALPARYFGEGLARVDDRLYWLTWKAGVVFVLDADTFEPRGRYEYAGEGWGLTFDGQNLVMSDGSATLRVIDPTNFSVVRRVTVREAGAPVDNLNELEYIDGEIWANVWFDDHILRIDPASGVVTARIDAAGLREALGQPGRAEALNGIAYDAAEQRIYVTGKYWPRLFEIETRR
jgi:glutaminyl-peptide cyclotransferase